MKGNEIVYWVFWVIGILLNVWSITHYYKPGPDQTRDTAFFASLLATCAFVMVTCVAAEVFKRGGRP